MAAALFTVLALLSCQMILATSVDVDDPRAGGTPMISDWEAAQSVLLDLLMNPPQLVTLATAVHKTYRLSRTWTRSLVPPMVGLPALRAPPDDPPAAVRYPRVTPHSEGNPTPGILLPGQAFFPTAGAGTFFPPYPMVSHPSFLNYPGSPRIKF